MEWRWLLTVWICIIALAWHNFRAPPDDKREDSSNTWIGNSTSAYEPWPRATGGLPETGQENFLLPQELAEPFLTLWGLQILMHESNESTANVNFDPKKTFLARAMMGLPDEVPKLNMLFGQMPELIDCLTASLLLDKSRWNKDFNCSNNLEIRIKDGDTGEQIYSTPAQSPDRLHLEDKIKLHVAHVGIRGENELDLVSLFTVAYPLTQRATRAALDRMLETQAMSRANLGLGQWAEFGYFLNSSLVLRNPRDPDHKIEMVCAGDLFMAAKLNANSYQPGRSGFVKQQLRKHFPDVGFPKKLEEMDLYLEDGIRNNGLLVSLPEFTCRLVGETFLMNSLNASFAFVLKPTFPYVTMEQHFFNSRGIAGRLVSSVRQIAGPRSSDNFKQIKTIFQFGIQHEFANFSSLDYVRVLNEPAGTPATYFTSKDDVDPTKLSSSILVEDGGTRGMFANPNQCAMPTLADGFSALFVDGLLNVNLGLSLEEVWGEAVRQHTLRLYQTKTRREIRREGGSRGPWYAKNGTIRADNDHITTGETLDQLLKLTISDQRMADYIISHLEICKDWRDFIREIFDLNRATGQRRMLDKLKLVKPRRAANQKELVLMERDINILDIHFRLQERLQRCSTDDRLPVDMMAQINCVPDGDDNDLYVRQLYLRSLYSKPTFIDMVCYPLKEQVVSDRVKSSLSSLNAVNPLISSERLQGFIPNHLKLGFLCRAGWRNYSFGLDEEAWINLDTVMVVNQTTLLLDQDTDGDSHDTLIDQWNWFLETLFSGHLSKGVLINNRFQVDLLNNGLFFDDLEPALSLDQSLLIQEFFPYLTYTATPSDGSVPLMGRCNQTCFEEPKIDNELAVLNLREGINEIFMDPADDHERRYEVDLFERASCNSYNNTCDFMISFDDDMDDKIIYGWTEQVNATAANDSITNWDSHAFIGAHNLMMLGSGREDVAKKFFGKNRWFKGGCKNIMNYGIDMFQSSEPDNPIIKTALVIRRDIIFELIEFIKQVHSLTNSPKEPIKRLQVYNLESLTELLNQLETAKKAERQRSG